MHGKKIASTDKSTNIADSLGSPALELSDPISESCSLGGLWLGQAGALQLEVCSLTSKREPSVQVIKSAWKKRRGRRAVPLIIFWQGPDRVLVTEPSSDPVSVVEVDAGTASVIIKRALATSSREVVQTVLSLLERTQGSGGVAGFRNRNLLSTHYLTAGYERSAPQHWRELTEAAASIAPEQGSSLLRSLGYSPTADASAFQGTYRGTTRVFARALQAGTSIDRSPAGPGDAPSTRLILEARDKGAERAIVVAGRVLRLYMASDSAIVDDLATPGTFIELDLDVLDSNWNALLPLVFSARSHQPGGVFDKLLEESARYAVALRDRFSRRVYENVVGELARALYASRGQRRVDAETLFHATLRLLYRLLFVLYAEDRNLLPLGNPDYRRNSFTEILLSLDQRHRDSKPFDENQSTIWENLHQVFAAIRAGNVEWKIPAYDGGLFEPNLPGRNEVAFLNSVKIPNAALAPILLRLAFDEIDGQRGKVDFADLGVRHLGTLYEGLLAYSVQIAETDLVRHKDGSLVPARRGESAIITAGEPFLAEPRGGRKSTGSYYTPSFVVRRLIDNALLPTLDAHLGTITARPLEQQWEAMLDFCVVDPAMGSGHFLVDALDAISARLTRFLSDNPRLSATPVKEARDQVTRIGRQYGLEGLGESVGDFELLRRIVMRNCIYGVDLNPMAVELANLSLWLHAFVPGLPLSYLGHNLRRGNALVGIVGNEIENQLAGNIFGRAVTESLAEASKVAERLAQIGDLSPEEVDESEQAQKDLVTSTQRLRDAFDSYSCRVFATDDSLTDASERKRGRGALEASDGLRRVLLGELSGREKSQVQRAIGIARLLDAFHWSLEFPEVFGREPDGFDVVLGNPPWEELNVDDLGFLTPFLPGIKNVASAEERQNIVVSFLKQHPDISKQMRDEEQKKIELRAVLNEESKGRGKSDLYKVFAERSLKIARKGGAFGMVFPRTLFAGKSTQRVRENLLTASETVVDFGVNSGGWIFADAEPRYTIAALTARTNGAATVHAAGPAFDLKGWEELPNHRVSWTVDDLKKMSEGLEIPLLADSGSTDLFRKMFTNGQPFSDRLGVATFVPWVEFNATTNRNLFNEAKRGWPVAKGENFDLWTPEQGQPPFYLEPDVGLGALDKKRRRSSVWKAADPTVLGDRETLPPCHPHILFRDVARSTDSRTVIAALVPPQRFAVHTAPVLVNMGGTPLDTALRLAVMCSLPFDWLARRRVETHLGFFILNALPVPRSSVSDSALARRAAQLAANLSCVDDRYQDFATSCGIEIASLAPEARVDSIAEIDALVARLYALTAEDLETIFADFTLDAIPQSRRTAVRRHFSPLAVAKV